MDLKGLERAYTTQTSFCVLIWYFDTSHICRCKVPHLPSFWANRKSSPTTLLLFFLHNVMPWAHHALLAWPLCITFHPTQTHDCFHLNNMSRSVIPLTFFFYASFLNNFAPSDLPHTPLVFSSLNCFLSHT